MRCVSKNDSIRIYYKADALSPSVSVVFNIWNDSATQLETNTPATTEISSEGVYYLNFTTPNSDVYLLIKGSLSDDSKATPSVFKVGSPSTEKVFYVDNEFVAGKTIPYVIYDSNPTTLSSGNLTNITNGFYSVDVTALTKPWFFEVNPLIEPDTPCS